MMNPGVGLVDVIRMLLTRGATEFEFSANRKGDPRPPRSFQHKPRQRKRGRRQCAQVKR